MLTPKYIQKVGRLMAQCGESVVPTPRAVTPRHRRPNMLKLDIVLDPERVNDVLIKNGLESGSVPVQTALLQREGMASGNAAMLLIVEIDGKPVLAKTSLRLMEMAVQGMRAAAGPHLE